MISSNSNDDGEFVWYDPQPDPETEEEWDRIRNACMDKLFATEDPTPEGSIDTLSEKAQTVIYVTLLIGEVGNGGFEQWMWNPTGDRLQEGLAALQRIGADEAYALATEAMAVYPEEVFSRDHEVRHERMIQFDKEHPDVRDRLEELTDEFFRSGQEPKLMELSIKYWHNTEGEDGSL